MQPNPNGEYPPTQQPQYAPPPNGAPQNPQWQPPRQEYAPPIPGTEHNPLDQYQPPAQQVIRPPEANSSSFVPDVKTKEILDRTSPEMQNALVNLAIKKFAEDPDYASYFVREEFKIQAKAESIESVESKEESKASTAKDFSSW